MLTPYLPIAFLATSLVCSPPLVAQQEEELLRSSHSSVSQGPLIHEQDESSVPPLDELRDVLTSHVRVPIHGAPDDPDGGSYGIWGAGSTYKASFHSDFTFVPYLGTAYPENREFAWRTNSVTVNGDPIAVLENPERRQSAYRYEYDYAGFVERYDILEEGVEQSFVIMSKPSRIGDVIVRGEVSTTLIAEPVHRVHGGLLFRDQDGEAILRYGAAFAIDANGRKLSIETSFDGTTIALSVPSAWLANAAYPVTIDPLLTRECVAFWTTVNPPPSDGAVLDVDIGRDDLANQIMIAYTRAASAVDTDMWVYLFSSDDCTFATRNLVFTDITTAWGNASPAIAFAGGAADEWIVAFIRPDVGGVGINGARYHLHASGDLVANSLFSSISRPGGSSHGDVIDVGGVEGQSTGSTVFAVYERRDPGSNPEIWGKPIDLSTNTQGTEVLIDSSAVGTDYTRIRPSINQVAESASDGWVVGFQEYWNARVGGNDDWDINLRRIDGAGTPTGPLEFPSNSVPDTFHKLTPTIQGANGHYALGMVTWAEGVLTQTTSDLGTDVFNQVFEWPIAGIYAGGPLCEMTAGLVSDLRWRITGATHDTNTDSHWAFAFESTLSGSMYACTTGHDAGNIERLIAYSPAGTAVAFAGTVCFNNDRNEFVFAYASNEGAAPCGTSTSSNHTVYSQRMTHIAEPAESTYGTGCGPGTIGWSGRNLAGIRSYSITLAGAVPNQPGVLYLALGPLNVPLFGGVCALNVNSIDIGIPFAINAAGNARVTFALPTCPFLACGNFYWQSIYIAPGVPPVGVGLTQGLLTSFGCPQ